MLHKVSYQASLQIKVSHTPGARYVVQTSTCITLQTMHYGKIVLRSLHRIVQRYKYKSLLIDYLPL